MNTTESTASTTNANTGAQGAKVAPETKPGTKAVTTKKRAAKATKAAAKRGVNTKKAAKQPRVNASCRANSKKANVLDLLRRNDGATMAEIAKATDWQNHYADVRIMPTCVGNPACGAGIAAMESA